jgi:threonine/homoserine/homoserine lactone efflux protein
VGGPNILVLLVKGFAVGLAIGAPFGPVGVVAIQRSLTKGMFYGLASGMGAAIADAIFGAIAAFGIGFAAPFLKREQFWFQLAGAVLLLAFGFHLLLTKWRPPSARIEASDLLHDWLTTFVLTISNPITVFSFTAVFVAAGINVGTETLGGGAAVVAGVFLGSTVWWIALSASIGVFHGQLPKSYLHWIRRGSGAIMILFGAGVLVHLWL